MKILQYITDLWTMNITEGTACQDCGKVFSDESGFKRHFRQYHKKDESDCHICERKFYTEFLLKNHIRKRHTNVNCDICDKNLLKSALNSHKQTHQENPFKCEMCDYVYTRKNKLEKHKKTCGTDIVRVRKEATGAFNSDACGKIFTKSLPDTAQTNTCNDVMLRTENSLTTTQTSITRIKAPTSTDSCCAF